MSFQKSLAKCEAFFVIVVAKFIIRQRLTVVAEFIIRQRFAALKIQQQRIKKSRLIENIKVYLLYLVSINNGNLLIDKKGIFVIL